MSNHKKLKLMNRIAVFILLSICLVSMGHSLLTYLKCDETIVRGLIKLECIEKESGGRGA